MSDQYFKPVPKPEGGKKKKSAAPKEAAPAPSPAPEKSAAAKRNKNFGKSVEREVAKRVGGERTIGSGAIKNSNRNLTGDVEVYGDGRRPLVKLEIKGCGTLNAKGDHSYNLKRSVLDQMVKEADDAGEIGALWLHWKHQPYEEGYIVMKAHHWQKFLELAKAGAKEEA